MRKALMHQRDRAGRALVVTFVFAMLGAPACGKAGPTVERMVDGDPVMRLLPPDAIPAIDDPDMIGASEADAQMRDEEPVLGVFDGTQARAYPIWVLDRHEIVNDRLGELPIAATW